MPGTPSTFVVPSAKPMKPPAKAAAAPATKRRAASSRLPLTAPQRSKAGTTVLLQLDGQHKVDLSGDMGAVGRLAVAADGSVVIDLQGQRFEGPIVPCCSCAVVGMTASEARIESVVDDFVQLEHVQDVVAHMQRGNAQSASAAAAEAADEAGSS